MDMANIATKMNRMFLLGMVLFLTNFKSYSQTYSEKPFNFNGCGESDLQAFFSNHLFEWGNLPTLNFFVFKLKGSGEISDIKHFGKLNIKATKKVIELIQASQGCWNLPKDTAEFQWKVIPFIASKKPEKMNQKMALDYFWTSQSTFLELFYTQEENVYQEDFHFTRLIRYVDPRIKID